MNWIHGKTAFITGGSSGIGFAISRLLLQRGAVVVLIARNAKQLQTAQDLLNQQERTGRDGTESPVPGRRDSRERRVEIVALDVADAASVAVALPAAVERYGEPDILVNCAGVAHPGYFEQIDIELRDVTMGVNFEGVWNVTYALLPFLKRRRGTIVNVASLAGLIGSIGYTAYAASKFAVVGFTEALRNELRPDGVSVSLLCPPDTDTPQLEQENRSKPKEAAALSPNAGVLSADTVAHACVSGMEKGRFLIIPGRRAQLLYLVKRTMPTLFCRVMDMTVKRSRRIAAQCPQ